MEKEVQANVATAILEVVAGLKPSSNQVAGHRFDEGRLGSLVDDDGKFYKPLQGGDRGDKETAFYETLWGDNNVPDNVKKIFPMFYGTVLVNAVGDKGPCKHAVMEDLTHGFQHPCVMDIKLGKKTWYEGASEKYIQKCLEKDASTTSGKLGFRVAGMQVYEPSSGNSWKADRKWCKDITEENMEAILGRFVSLHPFEEKVEGETLASQVYRGPGAILEQLAQLRAWFSVQTSYHFYSSSILAVYEGQPTTDGSPPKTSLRLVDFAHVIDGKGEIDNNFLEAIDSVSSYLAKIA